MATNSHSPEQAEIGPGLPAVPIRVLELEAERDRYRAALERIAVHDHGEKGFDGNCAIVLMEEAQEALDGV